MSNLTSSIVFSLAVKRYGETANLMADSQALTLEADEMTTHFLSIANATDDLAVDLGAVTSGSIVAIISDQVIGLKINGATDSVMAKVAFLASADLTSLTISNNSGAAAKVRLYILGA